jgi:hypothetical protein
MGGDFHHLCSGLSVWSAQLHGRLEEAFELWLREEEATLKLQDLKIESFVINCSTRVTLFSQHCVLFVLILQCLSHLSFLPHSLLHVLNPALALSPLLQPILHSPLQTPQGQCSLFSFVFLVVCRDLKTIRKCLLCENLTD